MAMPTWPDESAYVYLGYLAVTVSMICLLSKRSWAWNARFQRACAAAGFLVAGLPPAPDMAYRPQMTVVAPPTEAPRTSSLWLRVRIENGGAESLHPCNTAEGAPPPNAPCFAVAYRRDKRPPRLSFTRVEVAPILARSGFVPPGETMERLVRIPTSSRGSEETVFVYLVTGAGGRFEWTEVPLRVRLGPPPAAVQRNVWIAWALLAFYLAATIWLIARVTLQRGVSGA
jgi:hypothetical protein